MEIISSNIYDTQVLKLFSEHDDFMIDFLGADKVYYTRYSEKENLEAVWIVYNENLPIGCIAYRKKENGVGEIKRMTGIINRNARNIQIQYFHLTA